MCYNKCKKVEKTEFNNSLKENKKVLFNGFEHLDNLDRKRWTSATANLDDKALGRLVDDLLRGVPNLGTANPGSHRTHTKTVGEKEIVWKFPLAGAVPADVSLDVVDGKLALQYNKSEFGFTDSFKETLAVPAEYAINKSQAALVNGLLTVAVPRTEKKHQKIEIRG